MMRLNVLREIGNSGMNWYVPLSSKFWNRRLGDGIVSPQAGPADQEAAGDPTFYAAFEIIPAAGAKIRAEDDRTAASFSPSPCRNALGPKRHASGWRLLCRSSSSTSASVATPSPTTTCSSDCPDATALATSAAVRP